MNDWYLQHVVRSIVRETGVPPTNVRRVGHDVVFAHRGRVYAGGCCASIVRKVVQYARRNR